MKKILGIFLLLVAVTACQNNGYIGELYGRWKLTTIQDGGTIVRSDSVFWGFQNIIINVKRIANAHDVTCDMFGDFLHQGDSLRLNVYDPWKLRQNPTNFYSQTALRDTLECFDIQTLTWQDMVLRSRKDGRVLTFEKY